MSCHPYTGITSSLGEMSLRSKTTGLDEHLYTDGDYEFKFGLLTWKISPNTLRDMFERKTISSENTQYCF